MRALLTEAIQKARQNRSVIIMVPGLKISIMTKPGVVGVFIVPSPETEGIEGLLSEEGFCQVPRDEIPGGDTGQDLFEKTVGVEIHRPSLN